VFFTEAEETGEKGLKPDKRRFGNRYQLKEGDTLKKRKRGEKTGT